MRFHRTRTQPYRLSVTERVVRTTDPPVAAPVAVLISRHVPRGPWPGRSALPVGAQPHDQPTVQRSAGAGRSPPRIAVHPGVPAGRRGRRRRWRRWQSPVQDDQRSGRGRWPGPVSSVPHWPSPPTPPVVRRLCVRNRDAGPVLVGRQYAAARAARPSVADQRRWTTDVSSAAAAATTSTAAVVAATAVAGVGGTAATAAATVVRVAVPTATPSSPPPPDGRQSAVADQQRTEVHRENGQRTGLDVVGSGVRRRRRTTSSGDSQVNHA